MTQQLGREDARAVRVDGVDLTGEVAEPWSGMVREPLAESDRARAELAEAVEELRAQLAVFARRAAIGGAVVAGLAGIAAIALLIRKATR
jgi:hypothetical protein